MAPNIKISESETVRLSVSNGLILVLKMHWKPSEKRAWKNLVEKLLY